MTPAAQPAPRAHPNATLAVLALSALAYSLAQTMVAPALPEIQHELGVSTTAVTWVLTIFLLTASVSTPLLGRLGDMFGKVRMLIIVLTTFGVGSLVAALSHSLGGLIAGRAIQGAAGAIFPLAFGIIRDEFPRERVALGIGLISATFGIGGGLGLVLSGILVDHLSYEWIFWLSLIATVPAIVATKVFVPESPVKSPSKIDVGGAVLLSVSLASLLLGVSEGNSWGWTSPRIVGLFAFALVVMLVFVRFETRQPQPMVDMAVMRLRGVWTTNLTALLIGFGMFGSFILIPQFAQVPEAAGFGFGASVTGAGLMMLPSAAVMLVAGPIAGSLGGRFGSRLPLLIGTLLTAAAFGMLAVAHGSIWEIAVASALMGTGIGFSFAAMANLIVEAVPQSQTGIATGINTIMRSIGGALGAQVSASIVAGHLLAGSKFPAESGFTEAFTVSAIAVLVAFAAALAIPGRPDRTEPEPAAATPETAFSGAAVPAHAR